MGWPKCNATLEHETSMSVRIAAISVEVDRILTGIVRV